MTPEQAEAQALGKLDQRCLDPDCGRTEAAGSWRSACGSVDLEYRIHIASPNEAQWCRKDALSEAGKGPAGGISTPSDLETMKVPVPEEGAALWRP